MVGASWQSHVTEGTGGNEDSPRFEDLEKQWKTLNWESKDAAKRMRAAPER
jgi:hypothetical protein